jgi:pyruvate, water dikinase
VRSSKFDQSSPPVKPGSDPVLCCSAVIAFEEGRPSDYPSMGGKCSGLSQIVAAGAPVPHGFAITTHAYCEMLRVEDLRGEIAALMAQHEAGNIVAEARISKQIRDAFMRRPMPAAVAESIRAQYRLMCRNESNLPVAVRSSATAEDMPNASFAGQGDTYLWIVGEDSVIERVKACWASLYSARALAYRVGYREERDVMMAVGVQKMIDALSSGVTMTLDPATGDRSKIVIESSWGLGELVVSGEVTPDQFYIDKILLEPIKKVISSKRVELVPDVAARRTIHRDVAPERQDVPSIDDDQIKMIAKLAKHLERHFGQPQEIEWAIDRHRSENCGVVLVQCRPETVWNRKQSLPTKSQSKNYAAGIEGIVNTLLTPVKIRKP